MVPISVFKLRQKMLIKNRIPVFLMNDYKMGDEVAVSLYERKKAPFVALFLL